MNLFLNLMVQLHGEGWNDIVTLTRLIIPKISYSISLETAHPAKFREEIIKILGFSPPIPDSF